MNDGEQVKDFESEINCLKGKILRLENLLFKKGLMCEAPCFLCGYNGPEYYESSHHPCASRHHEFCNKRLTEDYRIEHKCVHRSTSCQCDCHTTNDVWSHKCCYPCKYCGFLDPI